MPSPDAKRRLIAFGLFLLPVILVKTAGMYLGQFGPIEARASTDDQSAPSTQANAVKAPTWTSRQVDAGKYAMSLRSKEFGSTPFMYEANPSDSHATAQTPDVDSTPTPSVTGPTEMPKFVLQAILSSSIGKTALIDGKPYHEGDAIRSTGWRVQSIQVDSRSATLADPASNRIVTVTVELPVIK